jgi:cytoskeletal protein CcmA (bactofilin family)
LTGNVTGNVSGTAATVTTAAQSSITSLGTLTTLTVDNVIINGTTIGHTSDPDLLTVASGALTVAGEVDATSLDISGDVDIDGNLDVDGITNLDTVDIDGAVDMNNTLLVGSNLYVKRDSDAWTSSNTWINITDYGVINTGGSNAVTYNGNGYRNSSGQWTSFGAGSNNGATQIWQYPAGHITFNANSTWTNGAANLVSERVRIAGDGNMGIGDNNPDEKLCVTGNLAVTGSVSKGSGSFKIHHPLESKKDTHHLVHSFIEGPQADLIYRGKVDLVDGSATVNVDTSSGMTDGTFVVLCRDIQSFTTNESGWTAVRSSVSGNILTIEAQDATCTDSISWMVVGERQDDHMLDTGWTDETGKVIVEPLIPEKQEPPVYPDPPDEEPVIEEEDDE